MTAIEFLYFGVGIIVVIVGVICWHLSDLDKRFDELEMHKHKHDQYFTDVEWHRIDDLGKLAALEQRVRVLEDRFEDTTAESTMHNNKIDTLEEKIKALEDTVEYLEGKL